MPVNKDALVRYRIINKCLTNKFKRFPSKQELIESCIDALGCNISERTLEKDLQDMRYNEELGYMAPIAFDKKNNGYFYTDTNYSIDKIPLNTEEVNALQMAVSVLDQLKHIPLLEQFSGAVEKIVEAFNLNRHSREKGSFDFVEFENPPYLSGGHLLDILVETIKERILIHFEYKKHGERQIKEYVLEPYLLKEFRNRWYIIGNEPKSKTIKIFGLDRIIKLEKLNEYFEYAGDFDKDKYFKHAFGITSIQDIPVEIFLSFDIKTGDYIRSLPLHSSQKIISESADNFVVSIYVYPTHELMMQLLSYGNSVKVVKPDFIQERIKSMLEASLLNYQ